MMPKKGQVKQIVAILSCTDPNPPQMKFDIQQLRTKIGTVKMSQENRKYQQSQLLENKAKNSFCIT